MIQNLEVINRFQKEVDTINVELGQHLQLKKFELVNQEWTPETGELSPTLKVKRKFIKSKYKFELDKLYDYSN
jgi:long-chain acyl-CoA synthetase